MCGICGVLNYADREPVDELLLREMTESIAHRGPDDDGFYVERGLGLGMRRLSIIDPEGGAQPIANELGTVHVVQNGEIYNYRELRRELEGRRHVFRTESDTEAIVHAYEQWGLPGLARLNGMFGIALWDAAEQRLVLARDPFGIKPLYWWDDGRTIVFGSEARAILCHPRVERAVDVAALRDLVDLTYVPSPRTAFAGIGKLLPGHALVVERGRVRTHRFHRPSTEPLDARPEELLERLRDAIEEAVRRQMVADVPVGMMLSGGVDSAAVAAIMAAAAGEQIHTFTVGFADERFAGNELDRARATARRIGSRHHEVVVSADEYASFLPRSIWHLEEPVATSSSMPFFKVSELAREHVKVVLTGQGADEPFAGYPRYLGERYGFAYRAVPALLRHRAIRPAVELLPRNEQLKRAVRSLDEADPLARMRSVYSVIDGRLERRLFRDGLAGPAPIAESFGLWQADVAGLDGLGQMLYVDARTSLPDHLLLYGDKMSMAVSLEARVPFLDLDLMALVERIPSGQKIRRLVGKRILKNAVARWVPEETIRQRKIGFATPVDSWFRGAWRSLAEERLLAPGSACREFFRGEVLAELIRDHASGRHDHKRVLFGLLTFEIWHDLFIRPSAWPRPVSPGRERLLASA